MTRQIFEVIDITEDDEIIHGELIGTYETPDEGATAILKWLETQNMPNVINSFKGKYQFLSNFYSCEVELDGRVYPSTEHAYQAAKTVDDIERGIIAMCRTHGEAKKMGKKIKIRPDWDKIKLGVMELLLRQKFDPIKHPDLVDALIATWPDELIEGNWWGDIYWGVCNGVGENNLGKLLMQIRKELMGICG